MVGIVVTSFESSVVVAALVGGVSLGGQLVMRNYTTSRERHKTLVDLWTQRLSEFYAPLIVLLDQDLTYHQRLRKEKADWHMLDNIDAIIGDPVEKAIADNIVAINRQIRQIIATKAGLIGRAPPPSFAKFEAHQDMLAKAIAGLPYVKEPEEAKYFPTEFSDDIRHGHRETLDKIREELGDL